MLVAVTATGIHQLIGDLTTMTNLSHRDVTDAAHTYEDQPWLTIDPDQPRTTKKRFLIGDAVTITHDGRQQRGIAADDPNTDGLYPVRITSGEILCQHSELAHEADPDPNTVAGQIWVHDETGETFLVTGPAAGWTAAGS